MKTELYTTPSSYPNGTLLVIYLEQLHLGPVATPTLQCKLLPNLIRVNRQISWQPFSAHPPVSIELAEIYQTAPNSEV